MVEVDAVEGYVAGVDCQWYIGNVWSGMGCLQEEPRRGDGEEGTCVFPVGEVGSEVGELVFQAAFIFAYEAGLFGDVFLVGLAFFHRKAGVKGEEEGDQADAEKETPYPLQVVEAAMGKGRFEAGEEDHVNNGCRETAETDGGEDGED